MRIKDNYLLVFNTFIIITFILLTLFSPITQILGTSDYDIDDVNNYDISTGENIRAGLEDQVFINNNDPYKSGSRGSINLSSNWHMFKNTGDRWGLSQSKIPGNINEVPNILWSNNTSPTYTSPVVGYDKVYLTTKNGEIYCFSEVSGRLIWRKKVTNIDDSSLSTPALANGHLFVYSDNVGKLFRINAFNGDVNWSYCLMGVNKNSNISYHHRPILCHQDYVLFGSSNGYFYCLNQTTGALIWSFKTQPGLSIDYGITGGAAAFGDIIYFGANDGYLYALDLFGFKNGNQGWMLENQTKTTDGDMLWKFFTGDSISATPTVNNDFVYITVGVHNSMYGDYKIFKIFCLNSLNGTLVWDYKTSDHIVSSPSLSDDHVYFGSLDKKVYCLGLDSNSTGWPAFITDGPIWSSAALNDNKLIIGSTDRKLYCIYTQTGIQEWVLALDSPITSSPALANDRIYICTNSGKLYSIGPPDIKSPNVLDTFPMNKAFNVPSSSKFSIKFSERLMPESVNNKNIKLFDKNNQTKPIDVIYDDVTMSVAITPKKFMNISSLYTIKLTSHLIDYAGNSLDGNLNGFSEGSPHDDYLWTFTTSSNHPPELNLVQVTPLKGPIGTSFTFSVIYTDMDNDPPTVDKFNNVKILLFINDSNQGLQMELNDTLSTPMIWHDGNYLNGEEYIATKKLTTPGIYRIRIWCSDGIDWNETIVNPGPVIPGPPRFAKIEQLNIKENEQFIFNLSTYLSDPDTPIEKLDIQTNSSYATVEGILIKFLYPNSFTYPLGSRFDILKITVSDKEFFDSIELKVWVSAVNDPPVIKPIPNQIVVEGKDFPLEPSLENYIFDIDNTFDELNISVNSIYCHVLDKNLIFNYPSLIQKETIILEVSDGVDKTSALINVTVVRSDVSFVIRAVPELKFIEDVEYPIDFKEYLVLIAGTYDKLELASSTKFSTVKGLTVTFRYNDTFNYPSGKAAEEVTITVNDKTSIYMQKVTFKVSIIPINDAPVLQKAKVEPKFGNITQLFGFETYYFDLDGSENFKVYTVIDGIEHKMNQISGLKNRFPGIKFTYSAQFGIGYHSYYFKCDDGSKAPNSIFISEMNSIFVTGNLDLCYLDEGLTPEDELNLDRDKDGIPDCWERQYGLNPADVNDALDDTDGDDFCNLLEFLGHDGLPTGNDSTDPTDFYDKPILKLKNKVNDSSFLSDLLIYFTIVVAIIIGLIILYFLITGRSLEKEIRIPKMFLRHPISDERPYSSSIGDLSLVESSKKDEQDSDDDEQEIKDLDELTEEDLEIIEIEQDLDNGVPVTFVDLTSEDEEKTFLESEEILADFSKDVSEPVPGSTEVSEPDFEPEPIKPERKEDSRSNTDSPPEPPLAESKVHGVEKDSRLENKKQPDEISDQNVEEVQVDHVQSDHPELDKNPQPQVKRDSKRGSKKGSTNRSKKQNKQRSSNNSSKKESEKISKKRSKGSPDKNRRTRGKKK